MAQNDAFRVCALAALAVLASACAAFRGPPEPIPADQVLGPASARSAVLSQDAHPVGADQLRGTLSL